MGGFFGTEAVLTILIAMGLVGGVLSLAAMRWGVRRMAGIGMALSIVGFGLTASFQFGAIPMTYAHRIGQAIAPAPNSGSLSWEEESAAFDEAEKGILSLSGFQTLLDGTCGGRSVGSRGGSCVVTAVDRLRINRLPAPYADALADWLIAKWPSWQVTGGEVDLFPGTILTSGAISDDARARFVSFMLTQRADPKQPVSHGWAEPLNLAVLTDRLTKELAEQTLITSADVEVTLDGGQSFSAGDLIQCRVTRKHPGIDRTMFSGYMPWRGTVRMVSAPERQAGREVHTSPWVFDGDDFLCACAAPDAVGDHELVAELTVELTRDDLRSSFAANPHMRPPGFRTDRWKDIRSVSKIRIPFKVVAAASTPAPQSVPDQSEAIRAAIHMQSLRYLGAARSGSVVNPPVTLAFDVVWVTGDREVVTSWFFAREGQTTPFSWTGPVSASREYPDKLILRPNLKPLDRPKGVTTVYNGPPIEFTPRN